MYHWLTTLSRLFLKKKYLSKHLQKSPCCKTRRMYHRLTTLSRLFLKKNTFLKKALSAKPGECITG